MSVGSVITTAAQKITGAIGQAARSTGISFEYLVTTAQIESRLNPKAKAPTSSATGLYQFIDQTWLATLKKAGPALGLGKYADAIGRTESGRYAVTDPDMQSEVMRLRHDPRASALMAAAFTRGNEARLESRIGRQPTDSELYIAHFLGSGGAGKLISAAANRPQADAVDMFPRAARANRSVFYDRQGESRTVAGVYRELDRRYQMARNMTADMGLLRGTLDPVIGATSKLASASVSASASAGIPVAALEPVPATEGLAAARSAPPAAPDPVATTQAYAIARQERPAAPDPAATTQVPAAAREVAWVNPDHVAPTQTAVAARQERLPTPPEAAGNPRAYVVAAQERPQTAGTPRAFVVAPQERPEAAGTPRAYVVAAREQPEPPQAGSGPDGLPFFRAMFSDRGGAPVTPVVQHLWTDIKTADAGQAAPAAAPAPGQINTHELFVDRPRDPAALFGTRKA